MNEQLKLLIELQAIDSSILSMAERIELLPRRLDQFKGPLKEVNTAFQNTKSKYDSLNKKKKEKDMQLDEFQDKINKLKARSGEIKTNKEYEAHLKEIEGFEKNRYKMEDDVLSIMEEIEAFAHVLKEEELKVKKAQDEFTQQEKLLGDEKKKLEADMETVKAKRKDFVSGIEKEYYDQYMTLLKRLGGLAVVETKNEICLGCNTNIPPQLFNDIKKNDAIYNCFFCKRFLYHKEPPSSDSNVSETPPSSE